MLNAHQIEAHLLHAVFPRVLLSMHLHIGFHSESHIVKVVLSCLFPYRKKTKTKTSKQFSPLEVLIVYRNTYFTHTHTH